MAAVDSFKIVVHGKQTHGAYPWLGVDPIVVASQIVLGLQTIPSRQLDSTLAPSIVTVGAIHGGVRNNIIPDKVEMIGTIRSLDAKMRDDIHARIKRTAENIATQRRRNRRRDDHRRLPDHLQRSGAHGEDRPDAPPRRRRRERPARQRRPRRRRLLVLSRRKCPASSSGSARGPRIRRPNRPRPITRRSSTSTKAVSSSACARWRTWRWII